MTLSDPLSPQFTICKSSLPHSLSHPVRSVTGEFAGIPVRRHLLSSSLGGPSFTSASRVGREPLDFELHSLPPSPRRPLVHLIAPAHHIVIAVPPDAHCPSVTTQTSYLVTQARHLEKQNELLQDAHRKMSHELHRLQVEEEMLMRKFYELSSALGLNKKNVGSTVAYNEENQESNRADDMPSSEGQ